MIFDGIQEEYKSMMQKLIYQEGADARVDLVQEECGELIAAISQYRRGKKNVMDVADEIADVLTGLYQLSFIIGLDHVEVGLKNKLERLSKKIR